MRSGGSMLVRTPRVYGGGMDPLGVVPVEGRGSLPYSLVHGESFVAAASWALTSAGVELFDFDVEWEQVRSSGRMLVLHDPLCPLTPVEFLARAVEEAEASGAVVVGTRPVTDTIKAYDAAADGTIRLGATVDRDTLISVTSPVVLPATVVEALEELDLRDLPRLVAELAQRYPVRRIEAPPLGRRVLGEDDLAVLAALSESAGKPEPEEDPEPA